MYAAYFGLSEQPFSISPNPRYLYMSQRHREAMAHLLYGIQEGGGFVQLTGEVGTGKTTLCRCLLEQLPENVNIALILNPQISENELLATLCDEIGVHYHADASAKQLLDALNDRLIETYAQGKRTVLVIDEAQLLTRTVLEQVRILTNLETTHQKLLQIILIGQPELVEILAREDLRQLSQRITARYHLDPMGKSETAEYIKHRLKVAGCQRDVFSTSAIKRVYKFSEGIPRLINIICDRSMLGAYSRDRRTVNARIVSTAAQEVFGNKVNKNRWRWLPGIALVLVMLSIFMLFQSNISLLKFAGPASETDVAPKVMDQDTSSSNEVPSPAISTNEVDEQVNESEDLASVVETKPQENSLDVVQEINYPEPHLDLDSETDSSLEFEIFLQQTQNLDKLDHALNQILQAWDLNNERGEITSCEEVEAIIGLRCFKGRGNWNNLRSSNHVSALLIRHSEREHYLVVTSLDDESVTFYAHGEEQEFKINQVDPHWYGEYVLLWKPPPEGSHTIAQNSKGVDILWLRQALNTIKRDDMPSLDIDKAEFDRELEQRILAFQKANNLKADGIVGAQTIIKLNSTVDPNVPRLIKPESPAS